VQVSLDSALFDVIADDAAAESPLWAQALRPADEQERVVVFSALLPDPRFALGVETIYEGFLLHYGRSRIFAPADVDTALLLGDYLYAHGLVRVAATGSVEAVNDLAELISLCAQARADRVNDDGIAWAATAATLGEGSLNAARRELRDERCAAALESVAREAVGGDALARALAVHDGRVGVREPR
jgi:hypothetical protein